MKRIEWIDIAKGQTIFLVVLVHVLEGIYKTNLFPNLDWGLQWTMSGIFLIIMPIFLALSGYLYKASFDRTHFALQIKNKAWNLLWPSVLFSFIYVILQNFGGGSVHEGHQWSALLKMGWEPIGYLWFLETLFLIWLLISVLFRLKVPLVGQTLIYIGMLLLGWQIRGPLILTDVCVWILFFFLGYLIRKFSDQMLQPGIVVISMILVLFTWYIQTQQPGEWYDANGPTPLIMIGKLASVLVAFKFFQLIKLNKTKKYWLAAGENSLIIYLVHAPLASILRIIFLKLGVDNFYLLMVLVLFLTWEISRLIGRASLKYQFLKMIFYPTRWWSESGKFWLRSR